ncbi:MAG: LamG domain-containing protein [Candidatus Heimdallarchaeota archaeon]|nr:LamG domain-containing protein [Candidatus Heimdallarchaeota archaeon]
MSKSKKPLSIAFQIFILISTLHINNALIALGAEQDAINISQTAANKIFHLPFDEINNSTVNENINGLTGVMRGGSWGDGINGLGIKFNSQEDRIGFPDDPIFDFVANDFTISVWIKIISLEAHGKVINLMSHGDGGGTSKKWFFTLSRSGSPSQFSLVFHSWDNTLTEIVSLGGNSVDFGLNNWQFIVITKKDHSYSMYVNGTNIGDSIWNYEIGQSSAELSIGYSEPPDANAIAVNGSMDEISIYNIALNNEQITNDFQFILESRARQSQFSISTALAINLSPTSKNLLIAGSFVLVTGIAGFYIGKSRAKSNKKIIE